MFLNSIQQCKSFPNIKIELKWKDLYTVTLGLEHYQLFWSKKATRVEIVLRDFILHYVVDTKQSSLKKVTISFTQNTFNNARKKKKVFILQIILQSKYTIAWETTFRKQKPM